MYRHPYLYGLSKQPNVEDAQKRCSTTGQVQARDFSHEYVDYGRTFEINDLAVDPAFQGRGIAKELLVRCIEDMKASGIVGIHLITANEGFLPDFYERYGFGREKEVILMGMELADPFGNNAETGEA